MLKEPDNFNDQHFAFSWGLDVAQGLETRTPNTEGSRILNSRESAHYAYGLYIGRLKA